MFGGQRCPKPRSLWGLSASVSCSFASLFFSLPRKVTVQSFKQTKAHTHTQTHTSSKNSMNSQGQSSWKPPDRTHCSTMPWFIMPPLSQWGFLFTLLRPGFWVALAPPPWPSPPHPHTLRLAGAGNRLSLRETLHSGHSLSWPKMLSKLWNDSF